MIVTLTANPSLDRTISLGDALRVGDVQVARAAREDAGGKGINVARVVRGAGSRAIAVLPLDENDPFAAVLRADAVPTHLVPLAGHARANVAITDPSGVTTKLNLPGVLRTDADAHRLVDAVVAASGGADWLVLAGSLPPGLAPDFYVRIITAVRAHYGDAAPLIAVDASGAPLHAVVADGHPDLIKPNEHELAELTGTTLTDPDAVVSSVHELARTLVPSRVGAALVTLGAQGAVLVTAEGAWHAAPPPIRVQSTVGAGDSSLAGYLLAAVAGAPHTERLRHSIRYGAAAASLPGTEAPTPTDLPPGDIAVRELPEPPTHLTTNGGSDD